MYDLVSIVSNLFKDLNLSPCDLAYTLKRVKHEGFPFLSRVLPLYAKHILSSIENGRWLSGFTHIRTKGRFPILFGSLLIEIFNCDGSVRVDANANSLRIIRQACEYFYKLAVSGLYNSEVETKKFVETDMELSNDYDYAFVDQLRKDFATYLRAIHDAVVDDVVKECPPRFGPGTYSGISPDEKWWLRKFSSEGPSRHFENWWASLSPKVFGERYIPSTPCQDVEYNELLFVPKDSRGPRTIVREPASLLRFQMAYNSFMSRNLERCTHNRVNFVSQDVNKRLAAESSLTREWATIDLSSASDRVSYKLMRHIFRHSPLLKFIDASTRWCLLPDGTFYKLNKLAGMGSGLTFPSMSLLIYLTLVRTICNTGVPYRRAMKLVYVYGDDIIVPTRYFDKCIAALSRVQLVPNRDKSFYKSYFRESCGGDYYHGVSVAPVRLKLANANPCVSPLKGSLSLYCDRRSLPAFVLQLERHCRELIQHGFVNLARLYYTGIERVVGKLPFGSGDCPGLVRWYPSVSDYYKPDECGTYPMVPVKVVTPKRDTAWDKTIKVDYGTLLRQALAPDRSDLPWYDQCTDSSRVYDGMIPRTYKFSRRYYSAYSLMG